MKKIYGLKGYTDSFFSHL